MNGSDELASRRRGLYPDSVPQEYVSEQVLVTVSIDADLYAWLQKVAGHSSFTSSVEETITSAVRVLRGDIDKAHVVGWMRREPPTSEEREL